MTTSPEDDWARRVAALDARLAPIAKRKVDIGDPNWVAKLRATRPLDEAGVRPEAEDLLRELLDAYVVGDEARRSFIRSLFRTYQAFAWAATLPGPRTTAEGLRLRLVHFSVKDQDRDPRDATLWLDGIVSDARKGGVDLREMLAEVAELSSPENRYGWGSTRDWLLKRRAPRAPKS
jgi:hypothetical protein